MKRALWVALALLPVAGSAGCSDYLEGPGLTTSPNYPTAASADQLFIGVQVNTFQQFENTHALAALVWSQHLAGVARQWKNIANYSFGETLADAGMIQTYDYGGLVDIRRVEALAAQTGNRKLQGEAQFHEALIVGSAADWFGDIPYSEAVSTVAAPKLDPQAQVYAAVQAKLDSAIANVQVTAGASTGAIHDFVFNNNTQRWVRAAHTLKARYYLHVGDYAKANAEALLGINDTARAAQFRTVHGSAQGEHNLFYEFSITRAGDIEVDSTWVNLARTIGGTTLLQKYVEPNSAGNFVGSPHNASAAGVSSFVLPADKSQDIVTYDENQMILAETYYRLGNELAARTTLVDYLNSVGEPTSGVGGLTGAQLLVRILLTKYVNLFMNPEVWADYRRTCVPNLTLSSTTNQSFVPARFYYGYNERISNPNVPPPEQQAQNPTVPTFPKVTKDIFGNACLGQVSRPGT
jgi:hypothetical protein